MVSKEEDRGSGELLRFGKRIGGDLIWCVLGCGLTPGLKLEQMQEDLRLP